MEIIGVIKEFDQRGRIVNVLREQKLEITFRFGNDGFAILKCVSRVKRRVNRWSSVFAKGTVYHPRNTVRVGAFDDPFNENGYITCMVVACCRRA